ncbi:MAG: peptidoglycan editing factor PgeF [Actinomycetota bacterium]|nr:peptidoglycan editing factor PgeF [Actinomycetota bacterium]
MEPEGADKGIIRPAIFGPGVNAFFTGREVGAGEAEIAALPGMSAPDIYMPVQRHTGLVAVYRRGMEPVESDAVIADVPGVFLGVKTADCVPVLVYDGRGAVGAVHAGWRGTAQAILANTINAMKAAFGSNPEEMKIAIGPAIRQCHYEVGREVLEAVSDGIRAAVIAYHEIKSGKIFVDLPSVNMLQAMLAGVKKENIYVSPECTFCNQAFHSYRRDGQKAGRQGAFIGL